MKQQIYIKHSIATDGQPKVQDVYQTDLGLTLFNGTNWWNNAHPTWWQDKEPVERHVFTDSQLAELKRVEWNEALDSAINQMSHWDIVGSDIQEKLLSLRK